jgi:hypothetical protein
LSTVKTRLYQGLVVLRRELRKQGVTVPAMAAMDGRTGERQSLPQDVP